MPDKPMKIVQLRTQNFKRLTAVEITPKADGSMVVIGGANNAGKTSVLDSIMAAMSGGRAIPPDPIRKGAKTAEITIDLGDIIVRRIITRKGTTLHVEGKDGRLLPSPQAILDHLNTKLTFDPYAFTRLSAREQMETLKEVAGLDFADSTAKQKELYAERTVVNRQAASATAQLEGMEQFEFPGDVPDGPIAVAELQKEHEAACLVNRRKGEARHEQQRLEESLSVLTSDVADLKERYQLALQQIEIQKQTLAEWTKKLAAMPDGNEAEVMEQITKAGEVNAHIAANKRYQEAEASCEKLRSRSSELTEAIEDIDGEKAMKIAAASLPIEGLAFDDEQVLFNGLPFSQAGSAEQLRTSVAMAAAMNPKLRIMLVRDGSLLDANSFKILGEFAKEHDCQVWMEVVGEGAKCSVIIEDGSVKEVEAPKKAKKVKAKVTK